MKKIFLILSWIILIFVIFQNSEVYAASTWGNQAKTFISSGKSQVDNSGISATDITSNFVGLGQTLTYIGAGVLVGVIAYMGIRYLTSSPDKQAALKQQLVGVVVAGVVIFGAYGIWKATINIFKSIIQ